MKENFRFKSKVSRNGRIVQKISDAEASAGTEFLSIRLRPGSRLAPSLLYIASREPDRGTALTAN